MAIIPHWLVEGPTAAQRAELADRLARLEKHRRLALSELRQLERFLAAHPQLRSRLPWAARGDLTRPRLVINNSPVLAVQRLPRELHDDGPDEAA